MKALIHAAVLCIFAAGSLALVLPVRYLIFGLLLAVLSIELWRKRGQSRRSGAAALLVPIALVIVLAGFSLFPVGDPTTAERFFRVVLLLPLGVAVGAKMYRGKGWSTFLRAYLFWATVAAAFAIAENLLGRGLFGRPLLETISQDSYRSVLASEHPLVLGTLLIAAVPLACRVNGRLPIFLLLIILGGGILTTQSNGPLGVMFAYLASRAMAATMPRWKGAFGSIFAMFAIALTLWLVIPGIAPTGTGAIVSSGNSDEASNQYRFQLYSTMWHSLAIRPFGWGFEGLPPGSLLVRSSYGTLDLSRTVDSEAVLAAFDWGILGLAAFAVVLALAYLRRLRDHQGAEMLLVVSTAGLFLALHSWVGIGTLWAILIGTALAGLSRRTHEVGQVTQKERPLLLQMGNPSGARASAGAREGNRSSY